MVCNIRFCYDSSTILAFGKSSRYKKVCTTPVFPQIIIISKHTSYIIHTDLGTVKTKCYELSVQNAENIQNKKAQKQKEKNKRPMCSRCGSSEQANVILVWYAADKDMYIPNRCYIQIRCLNARTNQNLNRLMHPEACLQHEGGG